MTTSEELAICSSIVVAVTSVQLVVCVFVYTLPPGGFFWLDDVCDIREMFGSTIFCCEY